MSKENWEIINTWLGPWSFLLQQCFQRVEFGGAIGGEVGEDDADENAEQEGDEDLQWRKEDDVGWFGG